MKFLRYIFLTFTAFFCVWTSAQNLADDIPLPSVPADIRVPQDRADYIICHFWDNADTLSLYPRSTVEQAFANFISVFPHASDSAAVRAMRNLVDKASEAAQSAQLISEIADTYLYDEESPVFSEDLYIVFLKEFIDSQNIEDIEKIRPRSRLDDCMKNRPGDPASDFAFVTRDGLETNLLDQIDTADDASTLLIFYDPDCAHCRVTLNRIISDPDLARRAADKSLKIIAVYSGDDRQLWEETASQLPESWTVGYDDGTLQENDIYIIRSLPSLYLISPSKQIITKNPKL